MAMERGWNRLLRSGEVVLDDMVYLSTIHILILLRLKALPGVLSGSD
jgi:hypothetical protein